MRAPPHHISTLLRRLAHRQEGGVMIEVIVSAVLVAVAGAAVLNGVDGSVKTAVKNRERSVAASLAEQDQERMRSYKATALTNYTDSRTVNVRGIPYTVNSSTQWVFDSSGTKSCTSDTSQASYLKLVSTVTPTGGRPGAPVTATSLLTAPNGTFSTDTGSLAVLVVDRNGAPRPNLTVNLTSGAVSKTDTTNSSGCANFFYIPTGNYTVTVAAPGLVDRTGSASPSIAAGVVGGQSTLTTVELDTPVTVNVNFDTKVGASAAVSAASQYATLESSGMPSPGFQRQNTASWPASSNSFQWTSLYPFTSGYAAYGGGCDRNDPTFWVSSYTANAVAVTPGGGPYTITARMPSINITVKTSAGVVKQNADVRVTPTDTGCTSFAFPVQLTNASGAIPKPGYPWGNYSVCADDGAKRKTTVSMANTAAAGTATQVITLPSVVGSSNC